ncbi:MAG: 30S ribosomal protein S4, partial [Candidatus Diapherotrites archaeon]|nr:30S ribosomal protein S4 [Candidatus Diapherotrites archaeon]
MGDPKRQKKHYERPKKLWDKAKVEERRRIVEAYGLKNKKEIWKSETFLRRKRENARKLLAQPFEARK